MPALADRASPAPYRGEDALASASAGEGHMDTDTLTLAGMEPAPLTWDMVIHIMAQAMLHPMGIHIDIHEVHSLMGKVEIAEITAHAEGGERNAVWNGTCWLGLCPTLCLPVRRLTLPGMAAVGWLERWLGSWQGAWIRPALVNTLLVPLVVKPLD